MSVLTELKDLRHLMITAPTVTNEVIEKVAKLPELQILCLRNTPLSDEPGPLPTLLYYPSTNAKSFPPIVRSTDPDRHAYRCHFDKLLEVT